MARYCNECRRSYDDELVGCPSCKRPSPEAALLSPEVERAIAEAVRTAVASQSESSVERLISTQLEGRSALQRDGSLDPKLQKAIDGYVPKRVFAAVAGSVTVLSVIGWVGMVLKINQAAQVVGESAKTQIAQKIAAEFEDDHIRQSVRTAADGQARDLLQHEVQPAIDDFRKQLAVISEQANHRVSICSLRPSRRTQPGFISG